MLVVVALFCWRSSGDDEICFGLRGNAHYYHVLWLVAHWMETLIQPVFLLFFFSLYQSVAGEGSRLFSAPNYSVVGSDWKIYRILIIGFSLEKGKTKSLHSLGLLFCQLSPLFLSFLQHCSLWTGESWCRLPLNFVDELGSGNSRICCRRECWLTKLYALFTHWCAVSLTLLKCCTKRHYHRNVEALVC